MDIFPGGERRGPHRLPDPVCPQCQAALVRVTVRTAQVVGYRCRACDETWNVPKPELPTAGATPTLSRR
jgi:tRNA(Ile2) C34 agmatinyltransferase TiaS